MERLAEAVIKVPPFFEGGPLENVHTTKAVSLPRAFPGKGSFIGVSL